MQEESFSNGLDRLKSWFNKGNLSDDHYWIIFNHVKYIPGKAWNEIITMMIEKKKPQASNFPTIEDLKTAWFQWRRDHPEQSISNFQPTKCDSCRSSGIISFKHKEPELPSGYKEMSCICGDCENWRKHFNSIEGWLCLNLSQIKARGWIVWPYQGNRPKRTHIKPIKDLFESIPELNEESQMKRINELKQQVNNIIDLPEPNPEFDDQIPF